MDKQKEVMAFCLVCTVILRPALTEVKITLPNSLEALNASCVVIPCTFTPPEEDFDSSSLRGIWYRQKEKKELVYDEDETRVEDNFKERTRLLGHLGQNNCTLEMKRIAYHDPGLYCFTMDSQEKHNNCVRLKILFEPRQPLIHIYNEPVQDQPYTLSCSIIHTCPSNVPQLTWNREQATEKHKPCVQGSCELVSVLTFIPKEEDDHSDLVCTAKFHGAVTSSATHKLYVKRRQNHNYIIIPTVVALGTAAVFGVVCFFMVKKYKRRIAELQRQEGSVWNRLSRLSRRIPTNVLGPSRHNQRHKGGNLASTNNQEFSKPRLPSPKSQRTFYSSQKEEHDVDDEYMNTADLNIYGNL